MPEQKIHVIGNDDITILFSLLGIESTVISESNEFLPNFNKLIKNPSIGMIIIGFDLPESIIDYLIEYKLNNRKPFIFHLPDIFNPNVEEEEIFLKEISESFGKIIT
jgi:vacuolar-type H+-ATPase subunit F/Vma7